MRCSTVTNAAVNHIAIVEQGRAVYGGMTGAWCASRVDNAPDWRIRDLAAKWAVGAARWNEREPIEPVGATGPAPAQFSTPTMPAAVTFSPAMIRRLGTLGIAGRPIGIAPRALAAMLGRR